MLIFEQLKDCVMKNLIYFIIVILTLNSCKKEDANGFKIYTIKEGNHKSTNSFNTMSSNELVFEAIFDESAKYESVLPENQYAINKLYGFADNNQHHQKNSARFGWRWSTTDNIIEIYAYVYNNEVMSNEYITSVGFNETHTYSILVEPDSYVFTVDNVVISMDRTNKYDRGMNYILYPYFGGDETAPHDIKIRIKELKN